MSCLPDIFTSCRSENLPPSKVGGVYSINLRQCYYGTSRQSMDHLKVMKKASSFSLDNKRYRSWADTNSMIRTSRSKNKSLFNEKPQYPDHGLQQNNHCLNSTFNKQTHQKEVESVSNFNFVKRNAFSALHIAQKALELSSIEENNIKSDLKMFRQGMEQYLQDLKDEMIERIQLLHSEFKMQRKDTIKDLKTLSQQLEYLQQEIQTTKNISQDVHKSFSRLIDQFI